jgi:hypothetical protein
MTRADIKVRERASSTQFIGQCICLLEVRQVESFGEPVMEGAEEIVGLVGPV